MNLWEQWRKQILAIYGRRSYFTLLWIQRTTGMPILPSHFCQFSVQSLICHHHHHRQSLEVRRGPRMSNGQKSEMLLHAKAETFSAFAQAFGNQTLTCRFICYWSMILPRKTKYHSVPGVEVSKMNSVAIVEGKNNLYNVLLTFNYGIFLEADL